MILKVMILPSANTEEQILYLLPVVITDPSCTIWSWKSFGSNYMLLGLKVREGGACNWLIGEEKGKMGSHFFHPRSLFLTRRPRQHAPSTFQDMCVCVCICIYCFFSRSCTRRRAVHAGKKPAPAL